MSGKNQDWLPEGWTVEVKIGSGGTKTKIYTDPKTGKKFKCKPDVLRYLNGEAHIPKRRKVPSSDIPSNPSVQSDTRILTDEKSMVDGEWAWPSFEHPPYVPSFEHPPQMSSFEHPPNVPEEWLVGSGSIFFASVIEEFSISYGFTSKKE